MFFIPDQILFWKPNDDWLQQANGKLNPQLFWYYDFSESVYQKFATSLFNFVSSYDTYKSTSFHLRKIKKLFASLSKSNIHTSTKKNVHHFKKYKFLSISIFINHLYKVYVFMKFLCLYLLMLFMLLVLPILFQSICKYVNITTVPICRSVCRNQHRAFFTTRQLCYVVQLMYVNCVYIAIMFVI